MAKNKDLAIQDKAVLAEFKDDLELGTEDIGDGGALPTLKITTPLSQDNKLENGEDSKVGMIYHTELKQDFEKLKVNITYAGEYQLPDYVTKKPKMTYILGGVMVADNSPFIAYVKGFSLQNMWDFTGEVTAIRNRYQVPMYPLMIDLTTEKRPHDKYKAVDVWSFNIVRQDGVPVIETNPERRSFLKNTVEMFREKIRQIVNLEDNNDPYVERNNTDLGLSEKEVLNALEGENEQ